MAKSQLSHDQAVDLHDWVKAHQAEIEKLGTYTEAAAYASREMDFPVSVHAIKERMRKVGMKMWTRNSNPMMGSRKPISTRMIVRQIDAILKLVDPGAPRISGWDEFSRYVRAGRQVPDDLFNGEEKS